MSDQPTSSTMEVANAPDSDKKSQDITVTFHQNDSEVEHQTAENTYNQEPPENDKNGEDSDLTSKKSRELKSILALSKEANLKTNISHKRKKDVKDSPHRLSSDLEMKKPVKVASDGKPFKFPVTAEAELDEIVESEVKVKDQNEPKVKRKRDSFSDASSAADPEEIFKKNKRTAHGEYKVFKPNKDIFCWRCHREGVNVVCETCPRSYHQKCLKQTITDVSHWPCPECVAILKAESTQTRSPAMKGMTLEHLCSLLKFAANRMMQCHGSEPFLHPVSDKDFPEYKKYIIQPMDLTMLEKNIKDNTYGSTQAFEADAKWLLHNSIIFNSYQSKLTSAAKTMIKVCKQEMMEIENCPSCYLKANTNKMTWFVEVCPKPHILVWAKLKGFPYWPAKAMSISPSGLVDVRFFGAHDRAWVHYKECYLYSEKDPNTFKQKRYDIEKCVEELNIYIDNLKKIYGEFRYAPFRTPLNSENIYKQLPVFLPKYKSVQARRKSSRDSLDVSSEEQIDIKSETPYKDQSTDETEKSDSISNAHSEMNSPIQENDTTMEGYGTDDDMNCEIDHEGRKAFAEKKDSTSEKTEEDDDENDTQLRSNISVENALPRGKVRTRGGLTNPTGKLKVLPRLSSDDPSSQKSSRRNSDQSVKSDSSRISDKINKVNISENVEITLSNEDYGCVSISENISPQESRSGSENGYEIKKKPIQVDIENTEFSISPNKLKISDQLMKRLNDEVKVEGVKKSLEKTHEPSASTSKNLSRISVNGDINNELDQKNKENTPKKTKKIEKTPSEEKFKSKTIQPSITEFMTVKSKIIEDNGSLEIAALFDEPKINSEENCKSISEVIPEKEDIAVEKGHDGAVNKAVDSEKSEQANVVTVGEKQTVSSDINSENIGNDEAMEVDPSSTKKQQDRVSPIKPCSENQEEVPKKVRRVSVKEVLSDSSKKEEQMNESETSQSSSSEKSIVGGSETPTKNIPNEVNEVSSEASSLTASPASKNVTEESQKNNEVTGTDMVSFKISPKTNSNSEVNGSTIEPASVTTTCSSEKNKESSTIIDSTSGKNVDPKGQSLNKDLVDIIDDFEEEEEDEDDCTVNKVVYDTKNIFNVIHSSLIKETSNAIIKNIEKESEISKMGSEKSMEVEEPSRKRKPSSEAAHSPAKVVKLVSIQSILNKKPNELQEEIEKCGKVAEKNVSEKSASQDSEETMAPEDIKSEPESEDEFVDEACKMEEKRKLLSALNIHEKSAAAEKKETNEIRTRSKAEEKRERFKVVDNLTRIIDDVALNYSALHDGETLPQRRAERRKSSSGLPVHEGEIFVKSFAKLSSNIQSSKQRARKTFPMPSYAKHLIKTTTLGKKDISVLRKDQQLQKILNTAVAAKPLQEKSVSSSPQVSTTVSTSSSVSSSISLTHSTSVLGTQPPALVVPHTSVSLVPSPYRVVTSTPLGMSTPTLVSSPNAQQPTVAMGHVILMPGVTYPTSINSQTLSTMSVSTASFPTSSLIPQTQQSILKNLTTPNLRTSQNYIPPDDTEDTDSPSPLVNSSLTILNESLPMQNAQEPSITPAPPNSTSSTSTNNNSEASTSTPSIEQEDEFAVLNGLVPETVARAVSELLLRPPPRLRPRPPGIASQHFDEGIPSTAGDVTAKVNSIAHKMTDYFRGMLIETISDVGKAATPEAKITSLQLEIESLKHRHSLELAEMRKNMCTILKDVQRSIVEERDKIVDETRAACEQETIKRVELAKSKQWCANCPKEAQFYCCWNTSYCDYPCQQKHWPQHASKCTQSIEKATGTGAVPPPRPAGQPLVLRPTLAPNKQTMGRIIAKPTKVYLNKSNVPQKTVKNISTSGIALVETTPGNYELVGNGSMGLTGKLFTTSSALVNSKYKTTLSSSTTPQRSMDQSRPTTSTGTKSQYLM